MPEFINENRILSTSQAYIQVNFKVFKKDTVMGPKSRDPASNFYTDGPSGANFGYIVLHRHYIQNAEFSGVAIGARSGKINIIDPEGAWANCLQYIGAWKNANASSPNMVIKFGWVGLKSNNSGSMMIKEIPAILLKTAFGMGDDGTITIELNFIENMENLLRDIKFSYLEDMKLLDTSIHSKLKNMKIYEILKHVIKNSLSVSEQLKLYQLAIHFEDTYESSEEAFGEDSKNIKIRLGDTLGDKINELIVSTMPSNKDDTDYTWSYEMINKKTHKEPKYVGGNIGGIIYPNGVSCEIYFGWRKSPKRSADGMTAEEQRTAFGAEGEEAEKGPTLLWKKQSNNINEKSLLSFDIDLKMLDYAASMIRSDLDKKLSNLNDESWDMIYEGIKKINGDDAYMLSLPLSSLAQTVKSKRNSSGTGLTYDHKSGLWGLWKTKDDREISQAMEEFSTVLAEASSNVQNQIETIINNNVFKAKAKIMGDPTIGTDNTIYKVGFNTDFEAVGYFANFFDRFWLLTSSVHKIEEGGYFTEIELLALPVKPDTSGSRAGGGNVR